MNIYLDVDDDIFQYLKQTYLVHGRNACGRSGGHLIQTYIMYKKK